MLKFDKFNDDLNTPFDTGILNGLSDPVLIVNENYSIVHYNRAFKRILEADPSEPKVFQTFTKLNRSPNLCIFARCPAGESLGR